MNASNAFSPVRDSRKQKVKSLYLRGDKFYGQLWVEVDGRMTSRKFALKNPDGSAVANLTQAKEAFEILRQARREETLPTPGVRTGFSEFAKSYLESAVFARKRNAKNEKGSVEQWQRHLRELPLNKVTGAHVAQRVEARLASGVSARTVNLDLVALRNVLRQAVQRGVLKTALAIKNLPHVKNRKKLVTPAQVEALLVAVPGACKKNAQQVGDYLRFLAYSGAREQEGLHVRWEDVDFARNVVWLNHTKGGETRAVDFNGKLQAHLVAMAESRGPSAWLFPSPQRGAEDRPAKTFRESLSLARTAAKLPGFGFHDLRHFFASYCVMSGVDFMTVASWMGHKDRGLLVAGVYGHLADTHKPRMAAKVVFA
jgi:integrase